MAFGIYIHIPYCRQLCSYCDFTKYELGQTLPPFKYVELLANEIRLRALDVPEKIYDTIYFGGGTPSLLGPPLILAILTELAKAGFRSRVGPASSTHLSPEITLEIDPATLTERDVDEYLAMGINRFSVGAQSFNDRFLNLTGRKHSKDDTVELLNMLKNRKVNYSFDLLFALPTQTLEEVRLDVLTALAFEPSHLSAYCLTVPEGHKLSFHRAPDEEQVEMFDVVESTLSQAGLDRYEISNFAKPGFESRHNLLYWQDQPYWGLGLSSHSYFPVGAISQKKPWGVRFWNTRAMKIYETGFANLAPDSSRSWTFEALAEEHVETLEIHQSLSDFCHTSLRLKVGLDMNALRLKYGPKIERFVRDRCERLLHASEPLLERVDSGYALSARGRVLANVVFEKLTFLAGECPAN